MGGVESTTAKVSQVLTGVPVSFHRDPQNVKLVFKAVNESPRET